MSLKLKNNKSISQSISDLCKKLVSRSDSIRGEVKTRGGELSPRSPCGTCAALTGLIGDRLLK